MKASRTVIASVRALLLGIATAIGSSCQGGPNEPPRRLSDYRLFTANLEAQRPAPGVVPYAINTPLFSDAAEKLRFVQIPAGLAASYRDEGAFDFPVGTRLIKTFYYPSDRRVSGGTRRLIETRLLIRETEGWIGLPYVWNENQTDAELQMTGARVPVNWIDEHGERRAVEYRVPSVTECGLCHWTDSRTLAPIATKAAQLNRPAVPPGEPANQLARWQRSGLLKDLPPIERVPRFPIASDPSTGSVEDRAHAYLDANCAHCHSPVGPASSAQLDLRYAQREPSRFGAFKRPVAAGRGAGARLYDVWPSRPDASILLYRIESVEPGVMMPELGRTIVDHAGAALVRTWIAQMEGPIERAR